ncbi:hypothetical protein [Plasmodium yoelii yoelii]|nr:hypothetical protein [Plasmodium yoelii yoelii]
MHKMPH